MSCKLKHCQHNHAGAGCQLVETCPLTDYAIEYALELLKRLQRKETRYISKTEFEEIDEAIKHMEDSL